MSIVPSDIEQQAYFLKLAGFSFAEIALKLGMNASEARARIHGYKMEMAQTIDPDVRRQALEMEVERLDQLQSSYYQEALAGDLKAAEFCLKVIIERAKLRGLDRIDGTDSAQVANILIVGGSQKEFIDALNHGRMRSIGMAGESHDDGKDKEAG